MGLRNRAIHANHPVGAGNAIGRAVTPVLVRDGRAVGEAGASKVTKTGWVGGCRGGGSGCLAVLVDESAAGGVSSDRLARPVGDDCPVVGCALAERPVGTVGVVVLDVVAHEPLE